MNTTPANPPKRPAIQRLITVMLLVSMLAGCKLPNLPWKAKPTPTQEVKVVEPTPTEKPRPPMPPVIVETTPAEGSELPADGKVTLTFSEKMERKSVEAALHLDSGVGGSFAWVSDTSLVFTPDQPPQPGTPLKITVDSGARAVNGLAMPAARELDFQGVGYLKITERIPTPDTVDVDPTSAVILAFNRPVVPLGADPISLPAAFTLSPAAAGRSEWINTSTYIFYPEPSLGGGQAYTAQVNMDLRGVNGEYFQDLLRSDSPAGSWSFTTALPVLEEVSPDPGKSLPIDAGVTAHFNQPMDPASTEDAFTFITSEGTTVRGKFTWEDKNRQVTFKPDQNLPRNTSYTLTIAAGARSAGGAELGMDSVTYYQTVPELDVVYTVPANGGSFPSFNAYGNVEIHFSAPVDSAGKAEMISITPEAPNVYAWSGEDASVLFLGGYFQPAQTYTVTIPSELEDLWGGRISGAYTFSFQTGPAEPSLSLGAGYFGTSDAVITPQDTSLPGQATNISSLTITRRAMNLDEYISQVINGTAPSGGTRWTQAVSLPDNQNQRIQVSLDPQGGTLQPGIYSFTVRSVDLPDTSWRTEAVIVSSVQVLLKKAPEEALVWVTRSGTGQPVSGAPVTLYDQDGSALASGTTDVRGLFQTEVPPSAESWQPVYALTGQPGDANFGMASSQWSRGLSGWDFGITSDYQPSGTRVYLYTDRPIYRPGQTVSFKAVVRHEDNGRYSLADVFHLPVQIIGYSLVTYEQIVFYEKDLQLSDFGTGDGTFTLPEDISPGGYELRSTSEPQTSIYFTIAEYRKPEINLKVSFGAAEMLNGQSLQGKIQADYYFGAPAGNINFSWNLYEKRNWIDLHGAFIGPVDTSWMESYRFGMDSALGLYLAGGNGTTAPDGTAVLDLPTTRKDSKLTGAPRQLVLEVIAGDESGFTVSDRAEITVHPEKFYIGVKPDAWNGRAGEALGFQVQSVDWNLEPVNQTNLEARFSRVVWKEVPVSAPVPIGYPTFEPEYTLISSTTFNTASGGQARLSFIPPEPGTYQLDVKGGSALTQVLLWVGGTDSAVWPNLPDQQLHLTADASAYKAGETARIFVPNPYGKSAAALLTRERSRISEARLVTIEPGGSQVDVPLDNADAPNIYLSVTLLGQENGHASFRQGYTNIPVAPAQQTLNVELVSQPEQTGPGDDVTFSIKVTDSTGKPAVGEFSLALVDLAALALAEPNTRQIVDYFYGERPLGVITGMSLAVSPYRDLVEEAGGGGGGGGMPAEVRDEFKDTAYWNPAIVTGVDGIATVTVHLPENLTTWKADLRGVTASTQVGQAELELVSTLPLLIRPDVPRFLVQEDHLSLAALVNNNTSTAVQASVTLEAPGFELDDGLKATQQVDVPAGGRARVDWWGTVGNVEEIIPLFRVTGGGMTDAARPELGAIPVLAYVSPQTFSTAGLIDQAGDQLEIIAIPPSFTPAGGRLLVDLSPSLAAALLHNLQAVEMPRYETSESLVSVWLPNLMSYKLLEENGLNDPELKPALDESVRSGISKLLANQNAIGGWGWWAGQADSDVYLTSYILYGLSLARDAGFEVPAEALEKAAEYLRQLGFEGDQDISWLLDRWAFASYALVTYGDPLPRSASQLYNNRSQLSPWAQALLALSLEKASPGDERAQTLVSDLEGTALLSATSAHWESAAGAWINPGTPGQTTAMVVYALATLDPASDLLPQALRYLASHKDAHFTWGSSYDTAWVLLAFGQALKGTGELQAAFDYSASLNDAPIAQGQAQGTQLLEGVQAEVELDDLYQNSSNALLIRHGAGSGRLYYAAHLELYRPAEDAPAVSRGISVTREYFLSGQDCRTTACEPVTSVQAVPGQPATPVNVQVTLSLSEDMYNLVVEDVFPAGAEIVDKTLKTSQQGQDLQGSGVPLDVSDPFASGWGSWYFSSPQAFDDHVSWTAAYLPAGTYQLVYTILPVFAGQFQVLPARAWEYYFPEVQGTSAGSRFEIKG